MPTKGANPPILQEAGHECDVSNPGQDLSTSTSGNSNEVSKKLLCPVCQKAFGRKYHLVRHLRNTACSGEQSFSLPCPSCGKLFSSKAKLDLHTRTHSATSDTDQKTSPPKRFECTQCQRLFWSRSQLEIHKRTHSGERPFTCCECSRGFVSLGALNKHKLSHQEEKPFGCPYCPAKFSLKGTLNRHIPTHTGIRAHKCPHCPKDFIQAVALRAHLFSHTGLNGFPCHICGHVFSRKSRLKEHVLSVHEGRRQFECDTCGKKFSRKDDLLTHRDHAHGLARKPLGGLNASKGGFTLLKVGSGSLPPPRAFAQDIRLEDAVITHQTAPVMLQDPAGVSVTVNVKSELSQVSNGTHPSLSTFQHTQKCEDLSNVQKSCTVQSSTMSNCDYAPSAALSGRTRFQVAQKLCTNNSNTNFCTVENNSHIPKQTTASVSLCSLYGTGIFCKANESSDKLGTRCASSKALVGQENSSDLRHRIEEFLCVLIEKPVLEKLGWPNSALGDLLEAVIRHCGCSPSQFHYDSPEDKLRENCKVLFTKVLEDDVAVKLLDNEETVDAVLDKVLQLARLETS